MLYKATYGRVSFSCPLPGLVNALMAGPSSCTPRRVMPADILWQHAIRRGDQIKRIVQQQRSTKPEDPNQRARNAQGVGNQGQQDAAMQIASEALRDLKEEIKFGQIAIHEDDIGDVGGDIRRPA